MATSGLPPQHQSTQGKSSLAINKLMRAIRVIDHCPRILSLDGGGIRGLSSLLILKELMDAIRRKSGNPNPMPCEYFDLIGGTSTGGLIAIMLGRLGMVSLITQTLLMTEVC